MKMMLRWMRERRQVRVVCKHGGVEGKSNPNEKEFLFSVVPPKVEREQSIDTQTGSPIEEAAAPSTWLIRYAPCLVHFYDLFPQVYANKFQQHPRPFPKPMF